MDRTTAQGAQTVVCKLDGSDSRTPSAWARDVESRVGRPRLVVTTTQTVQGRGGEITINSKEIYSVSGNADDRDDANDARRRPDTQADLHEELSANDCSGPTCDKSVSARPLVSVTLSRLPSDALRRAHPMTGRDLHLPVPLGVLASSPSPFSSSSRCGSACGEKTPTQPDAPVYDLKTEMFTGNVKSGGYGRHFRSPL